MSPRAPIAPYPCAFGALLLAACPVPASIMTSGHVTTADSADPTTDTGDDTGTTALTTGDPTTPPHTTDPPPGATSTGDIPTPTDPSTSDPLTTSPHTTDTTDTSTGSTDPGSCTDQGPELLAGELELPWSFSRHGEWIYFSTRGDVDSDTNGGIWRITVDGGVPELLSSHPLDGTWLATSPAGLFWSEYVGAPHRAGLDGSDPQVLDPGFARAIAVDATHFFGVDTHHVSRVPLAGGPVEEIAADFSGSYELGLDATRVVWTTANTVETVGKDGSGRLTLATDQAYAGAVGSDGEHVYWIDHTPCVVRRTPVTGGPIETLFTSDPQQLPAPCTGGTSRLVLADDHVYWGGNLSVQRVAITGGPREVLFAGEEARYVRDLFVDETHVYWLKHASYCDQEKGCKTGAIFRICKPA